MTVAPPRKDIIGESRSTRSKTSSFIAITPLKVKSNSAILLNAEQDRDIVVQVSSTERDPTKMTRRTAANKTVDGNDIEDEQSISIKTHPEATNPKKPTKPRATRAKPATSPSSTSPPTFTTTPIESSSSSRPVSKPAPRKRKPITLVPPAAIEQPEEKAAADHKVEVEEEAEELDSDDLDALPSQSSRKKSSQKPTNGTSKPKINGKKRASSPAKQDSKPKKKVKLMSSQSKEVLYSEDEEADDDDVSLAEGETFAGRVKPAPTTGHVPPGRISRNTMKFLLNLRDPDKNDREWFRLHEPSYRLAEKEWIAFAEKLIPAICQIDPELPRLPPKDVIHRIYRDIRFSNDKTPYKLHFSVSLSRTGRKGPWAGYFVSIQPDNRSLLAGGIWGPAGKELKALRASILADPTELKSILKSPSFVKHFGAFEPNAMIRTNVFGHSDSLKVAPQNVAKDHPDIELLKLKSFAAIHTFTDAEVLAPDFLEKCLENARAMRPLITHLNTVLTPPPP